MNSARKESIEQAFLKTYGTLPNIWVQAPGRVDLMGSHTDYNEGFVLTEAIERNTWIAARRRKDSKIQVGSLNIAGQSSFSLEKITFDKATPWTNYVRGVAHVLQTEGFDLDGFDALVHSTIPFGSGLSSSAALEVATAFVFTALGEHHIPKVEIAKYCQRAENEFVGMNCGILDQFSSVMGEEDSLMLLDCRSITSQVIPIHPGIMIVICDTKAKRELTGSEYSERRANCEEGTRILQETYPNITALRDVTIDQFKTQRNKLPEVVAMRCQFVIEENQRVLDMANAVERGSLDSIRTLMDASFEGARDLYEISCREMDAMMRAMISAPGVIGARQAGAGFGGCMVAIIEEDKMDHFSNHVIKHYLRETGIHAEVYPARASSGAGVLNF